MSKTMGKLQLQVVKSGGQLMPSTEYDAVKIEEYKKIKFSTYKQQANDLTITIYIGNIKMFAMLQNRWPTEQHLHSELKCVWICQNEGNTSNAHMRIMQFRLMI